MGIFNYKLVTNRSELEGALEVRREVFVDEQGVDEAEEYDGRDSESLHVVAKYGERVIGTARVQFPSASEAKIERMAILKPFRRKGIGSRIMAFLDEELRKRQIEQAVLHAQYPVIAFYKSCGFEETGSPFREAGIKHIKMQRRL
jgi:predicted GNAT family N-acyltransferase